MLSPDFTYTVNNRTPLEFETVTDFVDINTYIQLRNPATFTLQFVDFLSSMTKTYLSVQ